MRSTSESRHHRLFTGKMTRQTTVISSPGPFCFLLTFSLLLASVSFTSCITLTATGVPRAGPPNISRRHFSFQTARPYSTVPTAVLETSTTSHFFEDEVEVTTKTNSQVVKTTSTPSPSTPSPGTIITSDSTTLPSTPESIDFAAEKYASATRIPVSSATKFPSQPTSSPTPPPTSTSTSSSGVRTSKHSLTDEHPSVYSYVVSSSEAKKLSTVQPVEPPNQMLNEAFDFYSLPYDEVRRLELLCLSGFPGREEHFVVGNIFQETCRINCTVLTTSHPIREGEPIYFDKSEVVSHAINEGNLCDAQNPSLRCYDGLCADLSVGTAEVRIINATIASDKLGPVFDVYAKIFLNDKLLIRTQIARKTTTPVWNARFITPKIKKDALFTFKVLDKHPSGDHELLAFAANIASLMERGQNGSEFCEPFAVKSKFCLSFKWISETN